MCNDSAASLECVGKAGAPEEIEVTPEMIEVGARAIGLFEAGDSEIAAYACFTAMVAEMRKPLHKVKAKARL